MWILRFTVWQIGSSCRQPVVLELCSLSLPCVVIMLKTWFMKKCSACALASRHSRQVLFDRPFVVLSIRKGLEKPEFCSGLTAPFGRVLSLLSCYLPCDIWGSQSSVFIHSLLSSTAVIILSECCGVASEFPAADCCHWLGELHSTDRFLFDLFAIDVTLSAATCRGVLQFLVLASVRQPLPA